MGSVRQTIEDAAIAALKAKIGRPYAVTGYALAIEPYNGELTEAKGVDDFKRILRGRSPAVLLSAGSAALSSLSSQRTRFTRIVTLELFLVSAHQRTREHRLRQDAASVANATRDPGIYQICEDVEAVLAGNDLGVAGAGPLMPKSEDALLQVEELTVWRLVYECQTDAFLPKRDHGEEQLASYRIEGRIGDPVDEDVAEDPPNPIAEEEGTFPP